MDKQELKPCPFCGNEPFKPTMFHVRCKHCDFGLAVQYWNRRVYPPEVQQAVERMKPKKVIERWSQNNIEYGDCPNCICPVENKEWNEHPYCERCGQALDWSGE